MITREARIKLETRSPRDPRYLPDEPNRAVPCPYEPHTDERIPTPYGMTVVSSVEATKLWVVHIYESDEERERAPRI